MSITRQQALDYFHSDDLIGLGMDADAVRRRLHPEGVVTYIIDRNINYTNFCTEYCTFCAFYRPLKGKLASEGYILDFETIYAKIAETLEMGGTGVLMQGGLHPGSQNRVVRAPAQRHQAALPADLAALLFRFRNSGHRRIQQPLRARPPSCACATLASTPSPAAAPKFSTTKSATASPASSAAPKTGSCVHRTAHQLGMRTTATMMFGVGETYEHRVNHFEVRCAACRKRPADSPPSSPGASSPTTPLSADAAGTRPHRSNT